MNQKTSEDLKELEKMTRRFHDALFYEPIYENVIIDILSKTTNLDRQIIRRYYQKIYNTPIQSDIKSKLSSSFKEITIDLFDLPYEYDARELHRSLTSLMADENAIIEIFVSRPKSHLDLIRKIYKKFYNKSLEDDILGLNTKDFAQFLLIILSTKRPTQQTITTNDAYNISKEIIKNGVKAYGSDQNLFKEVFVEKSREDLILICRAFYELYQKSLYDTIENELSGRNKKLLKGILFGTITPAQWFAKIAFKSMDGLGTNENTLNRVLVSRSEIDMEAIREYYFRDFSSEIKNDIHGDTSGAYRKVLLNLSIK